MYRTTLYNYKSNSDLIIENESKSSHKLFVCVIIPIISIIQIVVTIVHHFIFNKENESNRLLANNLLTNLIFSILPLLPISYTVFYNFVKFYGIVAIHKIFKNFNQIQIEKQKHQNLLNSSFLTYDAQALLMQHIDDANNSDGSDNELKSYSFSAKKTDSLKLDYHHSIETIMHATKHKFNLRESIRDIVSIFQAILFEKHNNHFNQNVSFIYSTNFFFGLGSLTVSTKILFFLIKINFFVFRIFHVLIRKASYHGQIQQRKV